MNVIKKLADKKNDINGKPPVTIAFFGDSVTQGCFELYKPAEGAMETVFDAENAYHTKVRKILNMMFPKAPLNIINAGISGGNARVGAERIERDVLRYSPDLCVVCFGLNDSVGDTIDNYKTAMEKIFDTLQNAGIEVIHLTPNMMCTDVSCHITDEFFRSVAANISDVQMSGRLEEYLNAAKEIAVSKNIPVCDCYAKWKTMYENGVDINDLLANYINHPLRDMNWLFAYSLVETMFA